MILLQMSASRRCRLNGGIPPLAVMRTCLPSLDNWMKPLAVACHPLRMDLRMSVGLGPLTMTMLCPITQRAIVMTRFTVPLVWFSGFRET
jgi:hypothetical protein